MISDLLPLYKDDICSESSRKAVDEHIAECPSCRKLLTDISDTVIDEKILKEKNEVIDSQARFFKRKSAFAGSIIGLIFAVPILICLIVDIATGGGLGWFFIVLAAMMTAASLIIVPLLMPKNRMFTTMVSFTACVILLLAVCAIITGGNWFFVAASSTLFGLTMLFAPFICLRRPVREHLGDHKGLAVMGAYTFTFILMMVCIGLHTGPAEFFPLAASISLPIAGMVWAVFASCRYLRANALIKIGVSVLCTGILGGILSHMTAMSVKGTSITGVEYYADPWLPIMLSVGSVGLLLAGIGILIALFKKGTIK